MFASRDLSQIVLNNLVYPSSNARTTGKNVLVYGALLLAPVLYVCKRWM